MSAATNTPANQSGQAVLGLGPLRDYQQSALGSLRQTPGPLKFVRPRGKGSPLLPGHQYGGRPLGTRGKSRKPEEIAEHALFPLIEHKLSKGKEKRVAIAEGRMLSNARVQQISALSEITAVRFDDRLGLRGLMFAPTALDGATAA